MEDKNRFESLSGRWTYRSFRNVVEPVQGLQDILFGEGDLRLEVPDDGLFTDGQLSFGEGFPMVVKGQAFRLADGGPGLPAVGVEMKAFGVEGQQTAGWIYEYRGYLAPRWPNGEDQRIALVGTVIRVVPHGATSKAGYVASFVAVKH